MRLGALKCLRILGAQKGRIMSQGISEYAERSSMLLGAANQFQGALARDAARQEFATNELLGVAVREAPQDGLFGFQADTGFGRPPPPRRPGGLAAVLLEVQSANLLISAGLQAKEVPDTGDVKLFGDAKMQIETTRNQLLAPAVAKFVPSLAIESPNVEKAAEEFRKYSSKLLDEIVTETHETINVACKGLSSKLNSAELATALDRIGEAAPALEGVGRLVRAGIEKLRRAIDALVKLFGKDALAKLKAQISELWNKLGASQADNLLAALLGVSAVRRHIEEILAGRIRVPTAHGAKVVDGVTNTLPTVGTEFTRASQLLRGLIYAIDFAAILLGMLHFVGPWLALALGGAYLSVVGGAVLVGGEYAGEQQLLHWAKGVKQVAEEMA
jgi:hypothetical protein